MTIKCPKCGTENEDYCWMCVNCGGNLKRGKNTSSLYSQGMYEFSSKYGVLRSIASFCSALAIVAAVIGGLGFLLGFMMVISNDNELSMNIGSILLVSSVIFAIIGYIIFKIISEGIYVLLDIEENTRQTAVYSRQIANTPKQ